MDRLGKRPYALCIQMLYGKQGQVRSSIIFSNLYLQGFPGNFVNVNRIYAGGTENMRRLIFVFPLGTFSCDADHKF